MEKVLLKKIKDGDCEAFEQLYSNYAEYSLRVALAVTMDKMSAADAVQETFIKVYRSINSFNFDKPFRPWFYRILINECNRVMGKTLNAVLVDDFTEKSIQGYISEEDDYSFEEYENLYDAIQKLEDTSRVSIILKYLRGFKEAEIAEILGVNVNTVKSRLFKGRQKLRNIIEKLEGGNRV